ncbi:hypothetical protein C2I18_22290 [Paenibacillus sp. PK3_47]|nr:hypothetical protein C2I18_22290 [Paenibacillus sp. PK3_47]
MGISVWGGVGGIGGWRWRGLKGFWVALLEAALVNGPQFRYSRQKKPFHILTDRHSVIGRNSSKTNLFLQK